MYRSRARFSHIGVLVFIALLGARNAYAQDPELLWGKLQAGGNIVLLRHAQTEPGSGDPPNYVLGDCKTQRNLSEAGREQARRIGAAFRARKVPVEEVLASEFCRCLETARLAFGKAEQWPMLNSIFENSALNQARVTGLKERLGRRPLQGNIVIVSHNVNISAATGVGPAMGEAVIVAPGENGGFSVLGSLKGEVQ